MKSSRLTDREVRKDWHTVAEGHELDSRKADCLQQVHVYKRLDYYLGGVGYTMTEKI